MKYAILALLVLAAGYAAILPPGAHLKAEMEKYSPFPAEPGKALTVWIRADNTGGEPARDVTFSINAENPLALLSDSVKKYSTIYNGADVLLEYSFSVDPSAPDGRTGFKFSYSVGSVTTEYNFSVTVDNAKKSADLRALYVEAKPDARTGSKSTITIDVANTASGTAYYTVAKARTPAGTIKRDEIYVGNLEPDDFNSVDFETEVAAQPGIYPLYVTFDYKDSDDVEHAANQTVMFTVLPILKEDAPIWNYAVFLVAAGAAVKYMVLPRLRRKK
ncbi:MAG: hypothetical protein HY365_02035 [Candidatus Aenigmarchaeota archaeon]|nr:hypothetical protein [Candidatus Aenigmarchaeota archaeon]